VRVQAAPDVQLKYTQPREIIRSENDPILSELTGTVVIKTSWPGTDRRSNEANMYRDSAGRFGTIPHVCSYEGVGEHGEVISNISFLPQEDDITRCYWPIFTKTPPKRLDIRTLRFTVFGVEGKSLVEAKSPRQLSRAWAHFLLGAFVIALLCVLQLICLPAGWLSTYLSGHLHRDPSLGNVLMTDTPVKRKKFEIPKEFQDHLSSLQDQTTTDAIRELCRKVEELVDAMNISDDCIAFVTDGDLAISWRDYWTKEHRATKSVSESLIVAWKAVPDITHRVHPSSCPGRSSVPKETTCIRLWMTWSPASGSRFGACFSTRTIQETNRVKKEI